jgi:hypothetical protein
MSAAENSTGAARAIGRPFARGASGNPGGRSRAARDIQELAREHGPAAIATLAAALKSRSERVRVAAAAILLDRGYGRAPQTIVTEGQTPLGLLHLAAATRVSHELQVQLGAKSATAPAEPQLNVIDLTALPAPLE